MEENKKKDPQKPKNDKNTSYTWLYVIIAAVVGFLIFTNSMNSVNTNEIRMSDFDQLYSQGDIDYVETVNDNKADVYLKKEALNKEEFKKLNIQPSILGGETQPTFYLKIASNELFMNHVNEYRKEHNLPSINIVPSHESSLFISLLSNFLPILILIGFYIFVMRKMSSGSGGGGFPGGQIFSIGKSKAKLTESEDPSENRITFQSVAGLDEAKQEVMEIVDFLREPQKYTALGGKIPKGALLIGPPGTGKTLLAKAMAGEAKVPFFSISGSDFVEMFVGVGASRVRDLFKQAREKAPCIIFIDEIDAIGRARGKSVVGGNDERENTLNQLLVEMDGFDGTQGIIMIGATNRPDVLDTALLRPGRFDRQISIDRPDLKGREQIFKVHLKNIKTADDVSARKLAAQTPGFVGADIANICNEAALVAARHNKTEVNMNDFIAAIDRVIGGLEKKNKIISPEEKKIIAYHEAGHAICGWFLEHAHPLVKVTIVPRGVAALGYAQYLPKEKYLNTKEEIMDDICMTMGGRAAEKLVFDKISTGAYSDLEQTTQKIYDMVVSYGMSDVVGHVNYRKMIENSYAVPYSNQTAQLIDEEVRNLTETQYQRAIKLLSDKRDQLETLANLLLEKEVMYRDDLEKLFGKREWDSYENYSDLMDDESSDDLQEAAIHVNGKEPVVEHHNNINAQSKHEDSSPKHPDII